MQRWLPVALLFLILSSGCTRPWRAEYLEQVTGGANQDEVAQRLGAPTNTHKLNKGGEVWTYQLCGGSVVGTQSGVVGSSGCTYYVLTFDEQGVLRNWKRNE